MNDAPLLTHSELTSSRVQEKGTLIFLDRCEQKVIEASTVSVAQPSVWFLPMLQAVRRPPVSNFDASQAATTN